MTLEFISLLLFSILISIIILFQIALSLGAPWGSASMGGKFPGVYPTHMRFVAILNAFILLGILSIVLSYTNTYFLVLHSISNVGIWFVVAFFVFETIINTITPSKIERIWAPVCLLLFITSLIIALH